MFGKILEFKKPRGASNQGGSLPEQLNQQFKSDVLDQSLQLAKSSRISHINFGRESYFGLVSDEHSGKAFQVHAAIDRESKFLQRASCSCFRSNTRSYCSHVAAFIRYILRSDPDTGGLRSLNEDYEASFWHEISWFGHKRFGDSIMGFKAQANHGGEGIRISFLDRSGREILAFMPGERLVEEFLHEFFDLIRRDIAATLFKRMYGRKLKDPNVPSLRRRPWGYTHDEDELNRRGLKSARQRHEESLWSRIGKAGFVLAGRAGGEFRFSFLEHKQELIVEALDQDEDVILRLAPPRPLIGAVIEMGEKTGAINLDLFIHPQPLKTGFRIELTESSSLCVTPVVENPDPEAETAYLDRTELESQLYGSYYFFPDWGFFRIAAGPSGLPADYFSPQKKVIVPPDEITAFMEEFGELIRESDLIFADDDLFKRETVDRYEKAVVEHKSFSAEGVSLNVNYDFGDFQMSLRDVFDARRRKQRFLISREKWVDTNSPLFAWMDGLEDQAMGEGNTLHLTRTEYLRFLALNDNLEKRFSSRRLEDWFERLAGLRPPGRLPAAKDMKGKLRPYQRNGFGWLWFLYENGFSGLLCDDMGLGKTHQVMALMSAVMRRLEQSPDRLRFLVICPTTVLGHWKDKVMEYAPHLDPFIYHGTDRSFEEAFDEHTLIVTSYGIALRDIEMIAEYEFEVLALDEIQAIKNKSTKTYAAVKALDSRCAIGLTGTPIENSLTDLKSLFDVCLPGYLMSDSVFEQHFRYPIEETGDHDTEEKLSRLIHPFTLRRTKAQVLPELPPKIEDLRRCDLSADQMRFYKDVVDNQGLELVQTLKDPDKTVPYMHVFAVLNYLKQICDHPCVLEGENKDYARYESGKWDLFVELLGESLGSGQKVVVFSQYVKMLELIESYLNDQGIEFATIKGHTRKRAEAVRRFNTDPNCMVFSASLRASGLGIDLTGASVVIHYDRWWNSAREDQATDRVHRIGQSRGVQVFKLITHNTLEEKIDRIITKKKQLMDSVVKEDDKTMLKHFSREDLIELISY